MFRELQWIIFFARNLSKKKAKKVSFTFKSKEKLKNRKKIQNIGN